MVPWAVSNIVSTRTTFPREFLPVFQTADSFRFSQYSLTSAGATAAMPNFVIRLIVQNCTLTTRRIELQREGIPNYCTCFGGFYDFPLDFILGYFSALFLSIGKFFNIFTLGGKLAMFSDNSFSNTKCRFVGKKILNIFEM